MPTKRNRRLGRNSRRRNSRRSRFKKSRRSSMKRLRSRIRSRLYRGSNDAMLPLKNVAQEVYDLFKLGHHDPNIIEDLEFTLRNIMSLTEAADVLEASNRFILDARKLKSESSAAEKSKLKEMDEVHLKLVRSLDSPTTPLPVLVVRQDARSNRHRPP